MARDSFASRIRKAISILGNSDTPDPIEYSPTIGPSYSDNPTRPRLYPRNERSIVTTVLNKIAVDAASITIQHSRLDENNRFVEEIDSGLNECLNLEANIDQTGRSFLTDAYISLLDKGCIALVPTYSTVGINDITADTILEMRVAEIVQWYPQKVKVRIYNDNTGRRVEKILPKRHICIIENPFYSIMNERNATMQRLARKLALLDRADEDSTSNKLDLIIQLPYTIKSETRQRQAEQRRKDLEMQLSSSNYGIGYIDGTEKIVQLNRSVENNLQKQIEYLVGQLYSQLGITAEILDGTANEMTMRNYFDRTIEPLVSSIVDEMKRKFLTKTARTQGQSILYFQNSFKLVPVTEMAEVIDVLSRNEIMTGNEARQMLGMKPAMDPSADELRNKNMPPYDQLDPNMVPMDEPMVDDYGNPVDEYGNPL